MSNSANDRIVKKSSVVSQTSTIRYRQCPIFGYSLPKCTNHMQSEKTVQHIKRAQQECAHKYRSSPDFCNVKQMTLKDKRQFMKQLQDSTVTPRTVLKPLQNDENESDTRKTIKAGAFAYETILFQRRKKIH